MLSQVGEEFKKHNPGIMKPSFWNVSQRFIIALIAFANFKQTQKWKDKLEIDKQLKYFRRMVKQGAINLVHKLHLLEAEMLSLGWSKSSEVFQKYDEAVVTATRSGFLQDAALANYYCFQYCDSKKERKHLAELYFKRSMELWMSWGAVAVASSLADRHPEHCTGSTRDSISSGSISMSGSLRSRPRFDKTLSEQHHAEPTALL